MLDQGQQRARMVEQQLARRGVGDPAVVRAMRNVPRERFLPADLAGFPYDDAPLPIAAHQTISQPDIVARMVEALALEPDDKVLEIGTGSGYAAAVLAELAREVFTVERQITLCRLARERLHGLGYRNIHVRCCDGTTGWLEEAPFDAIAVMAGGHTDPHWLRAQLAIGGRLVIPADDEGLPRLVRVWRSDDMTFEQDRV